MCSLNGPKSHSGFTWDAQRLWSWRTQTGTYETTDNAQIIYNLYSVIYHNYGVKESILCWTINN